MVEGDAHGGGFAGLLRFHGVGVVEGAPAEALVYFVHGVLHPSLSRESRKPSQSFGAESPRMGRLHFYECHRMPSWSVAGSRIRPSLLAFFPSQDVANFVDEALDFVEHILEFLPDRGRPIGVGQLLALDRVERCEGVFQVAARFF